MGLHQSYWPIGFACVPSVFIHLNFRLVMGQNFSEENLKSLGFDIDAPWGDDNLSTHSIYLGQGMTIHVVDLKDVFLEVDGKIKVLPQVKNVMSLTSALVLFGRKVDIPAVLHSLNVDTLEVAQGVYDIAPTREEVATEY